MFLLLLLVQHQLQSTDEREHHLGLMARAHGPPATSGGEAAGGNATGPVVDAPSSFLRNVSEGRQLL